MTTIRERIRERAVGNARPFVMAHRGNSELCPENTLAAFRRALDDGANALETDLHLSADGEFMCIHDATLERTTNGTGAVKARAAAELRQLSASYGRPEFASETIPTLHDVLTLLPPDVAIALELKSDDFLDVDTCRRLWAQLQDTGTGDRAVILSFSEARLNTIRAAVPELPTGLISLFRSVPDAKGEFAGPFWPVLLWNPLYVWLAHRRGQLVCPLDPTPEPRLRYYRLLRCDVVLTNNPAKTRRALDRLTG